MINVERPAISKNIGEAIEKGDISENAEFSSAKEHIDKLNKKIIDLEQKKPRSISRSWQSLKHYF